MNELSELCPQALELVTLFSITTPLVYSPSTVEAHKLHVRVCAPCRKYVNSFGTRHERCICEFCRPACQGSSAVPKLCSRSA